MANNVRADRRSGDAAQHEGASCVFVFLPFCLLVELGRELFARSLAKQRFDRSAGIAAGAAGKPFGLDGGFAVGRNGNGDCFQTAPPTVIVSLMLPSAKGFSVTECPWRWAWIRAASTA